MAERVTHWLPSDPDTESLLAACGLDIRQHDDSAWTRVRDLREWVRLHTWPVPYPPPCPQCLIKADATGVD